MDKSKSDEAERIIMDRSWWHPIEWLMPLLILAGGVLVMSVYAFQGQSIRGALQVTVGGLILDRFAWATHRAWWQLKHRRTNQDR